MLRALRKSRIAREIAIEQRFAAGENNLPDTEMNQ